MSADSGNDGVRKPIDLNLISDEDLKREANKIREAKKLAKERDSISPSSTSTSSPASSKTDSDTKKRERELKKREAELKKRQREIDKKIKKLEDKIQNITDRGGEFFENPQGAIQNEFLNLMTKAGPAGVIAALGPQIIEAILAEFEDGGVFDTRVKELNEAKTVGSLDYLLQIQNGTVLFTDQAFLTDEPPSVINTEKLVAGQMRFYQFNSGEYTGIIDQ